MTKFIISLLLLLTTTTAFAENLFCTVSVNLDVVAEAEFNVTPKSKVNYVQADDFNFAITNLGNSKFEIEIFDKTIPSRSYVQGFLKEKDQALTWTLWTRDVLLETSCKLSGSK